MRGLVRIEEKENYLYCIAEHFDNTFENKLTFAEDILKVCQKTRKGKIFIDFTANHESTNSTSKAMTGIQLEELLLHFQRYFGITLRVSVLGSPTRILSTYKPLQETLNISGIPFASFTDDKEAREWLFKDESD